MRPSTTRRPAAPIQLVCGVTATAVLIAVCSGCSAGRTHSPGATTPPPAGTPAAPPPPPAGAQIDQSDATAVAKAAVSIMWSYDADRDARDGQRAAYLRASAYFTAAYRAEATGMHPTPLPSELIVHRAYSQTTLTAEPATDAGPDTAQTASRIWKVTVRPVGRDGWHGTPVIAHVYINLTRPGPLQPWRINNTTAD